MVERASSVAFGCVANNPSVERDEEQTEAHEPQPEGYVHIHNS
jgi:hypothetical protein